MRHCSLVSLVVLAVLLAGCASVSGDAAMAAKTESAESALPPVEPSPDQAPESVAADSAATAIVAATSDGDTGEHGVEETAIDDEPVEVMTVIEKRIPTWKGRRQIYRDVDKGKRLFALKQIDEAFPYLLDTAQRGFKDSQARVGHIYLQGLGTVEPDATQGVGWLGAASSGSTSPGIRNYFNEIWERIPETQVAYFEEVVEDYRSRYGEAATGVVCDLERPVRSFVKNLACFFEAPLPEDIRIMLKDFQGSEEAREILQEQLAAAREAIEQSERCRNPALAAAGVNC